MNFKGTGERTPLRAKRAVINSAASPGVSPGATPTEGATSNLSASSQSFPLSLPQVPSDTSITVPESATAENALFADANPATGEREFESKVLKDLFWTATVVLPSAFTIIGYAMINLGNAPPDEKDRNTLNVFLATPLGMILNAFVSSITNWIFTAINVHNELYHNAIKRSSYSASNMLLVFLAVIAGVCSGINYIPLMKKVVPQLLTNLAIEKTPSTEMSANILAGCFIATMMLLNAMSVYEIGFQEIPKGYRHLREVMSRRGANALLEDEASNTAMLEPQRPSCLTLERAQNLGLWSASLAMGVFYYLQLVQYVQKGLGISPALAYIISAGDLMFGISYAKKGFGELGRGTLNVFKKEDSVGFNVVKAVFGVLSLTWAFFTIIPAMSQGQPGVAKFGMAATSEVFNFGSANRLINAIAAALLLNFRVAGYSLYKTRKSDGHGEAHALETGFYTGDPEEDLKSTPWRRCCRGEYARLPEATPLSPSAESEL